jgi:hypothetical protein
MRWNHAIVAALAVCAYASGASAQSTASSAEAQRAFDEARALAEHDRWPEACARLAESLRLEANMTTQFRLADCYERIGRVASAFLHYSAAAEAAGAAGEPGKSKAAAERAARLEPRVDRLIIAPPAMPDIHVERDGKIVPREAWNAPQPTDPGEHTVHVSAPGKTSYDTLVTFAGKGETVRIDVPVLEPALPWRLSNEGTRTFNDLPRAGAEPPRPARDTVMYTIGWGIVGLGTVSVIGGGGLFVAEATRNEPCSSGRCVPSVVLLGAGAVAVIAGTLLVLAASH